MAARAKSFARWPSSDQLIPDLAKETNGVCLLSFSAGKDSLAAWLALRPHFTRIVPVFFYLVPGIDFVERALQYYEEFFETPIVRFPHPVLLSQLWDQAFQPPHRLEALYSIPESMKPTHFDNYVEVIRNEQKLPERTLQMNGVRALDSVMRRTHLARHGPVSWKNLTCHPIWDWDTNRVKAAILKSGVKMPAYYEWFGRSWDGYYWRYLVQIKRYAPDDYKLLLEWFPLLPVILARAEQVWGTQGKVDPKSKVRRKQWGTPAQRSV